MSTAFKGISENTNCYDIAISRESLPRTQKLASASIPSLEDVYRRKSHSDVIAAGPRYTMDE
jgi:hypothetical protein